MDVRRLDRGGHRGKIDAEAVILRRDFDPSSRQILDWLVGASVTELQLVGLRAESPSEELMAETNTE
jgi:hypothetical protein